MLDLSKIDYGYEGIQIILKGGSNTVINSIVTNEGTRISFLELNDIIMGTSTLHVKEIRFSNCAVDGHPTLTFKNCEQMTVDDNYIQKISPCISSSAKIQKISYRMDKYDQMTITNESFIFYDVEIDDFTKPFNLDVQKIKGSTVFIQQQSQNQLTVKLQLGSGIISLISLDKVLANKHVFRLDRC